MSAHGRLAEAETCRRKGELGRAQRLCEALVKEYPDYVGALQTLGVIHLARKNFQQAFVCFIQAVMHCPRDVVNLTNLATACLRLGAREMAAQTLEQARRLNPDDAMVYLGLAEIHREDREYELAAECYRHVQSLLPAHAEAAHGLGDCYSHLGRVKEAATALERAHTLNPNSVAVLYALCQLPPSATDIDILSALDRVQKQDLADRQEFETFASFTRSTALDRQGRYREAWTSLVEANRREFPKHERAHLRHRQRTEYALKAALARPLLEPTARPPAPDDHPLSLFIIGPSRSGKSSLEHLASSLGGVKRGHESRLVERAVRRTSQISGILTTSDANELPPPLDGRLRQVYAEEVKEFARGALIVTDTYPAIISYVGRIAAAIPNTRFVFLKRDPDDLALRIFMKHYRAGNHYAYDIKTIFEHLSWYYRMTDAWLEKLPGITLAIDYDEMIARPRAALARVAELCRAGDVPSALPELIDDRDCARPYRAFIAAARR
jgi:tetratricopeptide (TPR) repeat protein